MVAKHVKLLATLGPASMSREKVEAMDRDGVDIFRLNLSHTPLEELAERIRAIQSWTRKPLCLDSEGAQVRTGRIQAPGWTTLTSHATILLTDASEDGAEGRIPLYPIAPAQVLKVGDTLHLDFNSAIVQVLGPAGGRLRARVLSGGVVGSNKAVAIDRDVPLPPFTQKDEKAFEIGAALGITHVALSFAGSADGVRRLRARYPYPVSVISKIESRQGLRNLPAIARESDALLIDRGDLSREIPIQKVGLAQQHIIESAQAAEVPVFVATNLLETMLTDRQPRRGEINDITSALLSRIDGLVLAAETAIGKYPVEAVRMIAGIVAETRSYLDLPPRRNKVDFLSAYPDHEPVGPHGGALVDAYVEESDVEDLRALPAIRLDQRAVLDLRQIADGVYSPLRGFMSGEEVRSVLETNRLLAGATWTLPIVLQRNGDAAAWADEIAGSPAVLLRGPDGTACGVLYQPRCERLDMPAVARRWFGTDSGEHAGVALFYARGDAILSGEVRAVRNPAARASSHALTPLQTRRIFQQFGWKRIVGFHTRNVLHRGHEFIQKSALARASADALMISPVVGPKKAGDFTPEAIVGAYELMLGVGGYRPWEAILNCVGSYPRYGGAREAVFTALCRQNYGCTHFVIGRDHAGVGSSAESDALKRLFADVGDLEIIPLFFDTVYHCDRCGGPTMGCGHGATGCRTLSGSEVRRHLLAGADLPDYLVRPEIGELLQTMRAQSRPVFQDTIA